MRHSLPAPLGAHQNDSILVVTGVEGRPLSHVLKRDANRLTGLLRRRQLSASGAMVGIWLRRFHDATSRAPTPHDHERFCRELDAALQRLGAAAGTEGLAGVSDRLARASARLDGAPLATAAGHGDFLPQNVLIRRDSAAVVDFENYRLRETVHRDAGAMLAYTMMLQRQRRYHAGALRVFAAAFEHGYGGRLHTNVQRLFTAEGAVRIARDSAQPRTRHIMLATVAALMAENETELEA